MRPLVYTNQQLVIALSPDTGERLWERKFERTPTKIFLLGDSLFLSVQDDLMELNVLSGETISTMRLGYRIHAGFVANEKLYIAGSGLACLGPKGKIYWSAKNEQKAKGSLFSVGERAFVARSADNKVLWETQLGDKYGGDGVGLLYESFLSQIDESDLA